MRIRILLLAACAVAPYAAAQKVTFEFDENVDFSKFHTFAIRDGRLNSRNPALNSDLVKKQIEADIQRDLAARGLVLVTGRSDLNVRYTFGAVPRMEREAYPAGWRGWGTRIVRVPYTEGTLVIDLRDPTTRSLVWRGIATEEKEDPTKIQKKVDDMVRKSLEKYPPKKP
jgi:hypothetical protein